ncbi:MAG TPA: hypothetical protein VIK91_28375 [Nannocystis sp.]
MRLRTRPVLFARLFVDAATTRPFLRDLLDQRRAGEPALEPVKDGDNHDAPPALPRAA